MAQPYYDGKLYFATDTNQIVLDVNGSKHIMGGGGSTGSGVIYAKGTEEQIIKVDPDNDDDFNYTMAMAALENPAVEPPVDGLILNSDGRFFRVISVDLENKTMEVVLLAVSGSGEGGGTPVEQDLFLDYDGIDLLGSTYIYGQSNIITFAPRSTTDSFVSFLLVAKDLNGVYEDVKRQTRLYNGDVYEFNTNLLPNSDNIEITVTITATMSQWNKGKGLTYTFTPIHVLNMYLEKPSNIVMGIAETDTSVPYIPYFDGLGGQSAPVRTHYSIDGAEASTTVRLTTANSGYEQHLDIPMQPHGMHTIRV